MKAATIAYFQLQHTVSAPAPVQFQTLCENCRGYEPGMQYSEFVRRLPSDESVQPESFIFEPYISEDMKYVSLNLLDSRFKVLNLDAHRCNKNLIQVTS